MVMSHCMIPKNAYNNGGRFTDTPTNLDIIAFPQAVHIFEINTAITDDLRGEGIKRKVQTKLSIARNCPGFGLGANVAL